VAETLPGFVATGWLALLARTGTPDSIVQTLSAALRASLADPELKEKFGELATLPASNVAGGNAGFHCAGRKKLDPGDPEGRPYHRVSARPIAALVRTT
jgi:hypothetical protein